MSLSLFWASIAILLKGVDSVSYRSVYTVPANKLVHITSLFRTGKNTGRIGQFWAISAGTEKSFLFFFLSFVIFEFLLGQNGNLFALTYYYYLFSYYAMVTFKLSIFYIVFFFFLSFN